MLYRFILVFIFCRAFCISLPALATDSSRVKRVSVFPVPTIGYAPETSWYLGGAALLNLRLFDSSRTSNAKVELNYTLKKQLIISSEHFFYTQKNRWLCIGENAWQKFPEFFYGIGSRSSKAMEEEYSARRLEIYNIFARQVKKNLYLGALLRLQYMKRMKLKEGGLLAAGNISGAGGGLSSGLGYALIWDRRDNLLNPGPGNSYLFFSQVFFGNASGSDYHFSRLELDARIYFKSLGRHLLALQGYGVLSSGQPPFRMLALLGSDSHARGYYTGRFRDRQYLSVQAEYRIPLYRAIGMTAFAGLAQVAHDLPGMELSQLKYSLGAGLRIRVDKKDKVNMRFDFATGRNSSGFYVSFGEAF